MGKGVSACATCDGFFYKEPGRRRRRRRQHRGRGGAVPRRTSRRTSRVVHRRDKFRAEAILIDRLIGEDHAAAATCACCGTTSLDDVLGDDVRRHRRSRDGHEAKRDAGRLAVHGVFIAIGHTPNTQIFEGQLDMAGGYIQRQGRQRRATPTRRVGRRRIRRRRRYVTGSTAVP